MMRDSKPRLRPADLHALVESAIAWHRATGERETFSRKRGVSLVSDKSVPQECPRRVSHKSVP